MADELNGPTDEMVEALAAKLREGTGQDTTWSGDCLDVARSALSAALAVDPKRQGGGSEVQAVIPCGGCGATRNAERCIGCMHDFGTADSAWVRRYGPGGEHVQS